MNSGFEREKGESLLKPKSFWLSNSFSLRKKLIGMRKGGKLLSLEKTGRIGFMKQLEIVLHCNLELV